MSYPRLREELVYWDDSLRGYGLKVTPKGRKVLIALYRANGARPRKYTIGPYGQVTPQQARSTAQKVFAAKLDGRDPAAEDQTACRGEIVDRLDATVERFLAERTSKLRSAPRLTSIFRREVLPVGRARNIHDIKRREMMELVCGFICECDPQRIKLLNALKRLFNWCADRRPSNLRRQPASPDPERSRIQRRRACGRRPPANARPLQCDCRDGRPNGSEADRSWRSDLGELDLPNRTWMISARHSKNAKTHIVHLSTSVLELLMRVSRRVREHGYARV